MIKRFACVSEKPGKSVSYCPATMFNSFIWYRGFDLTFHTNNLSGKYFFQFLFIDEDP